MLSLFGKEIRPSIDQVFTPRRTEVNRAIYVDRVALEKALIRALGGSLHTMIYGESGSGKSWLYKKVLSDIGALVATANCANAVRLKSLTAEIQQVVDEEEPKRLAEHSEEMNTTLKAVVAEGGLKSTRKYTFSESDPFLDCVRILRERAGSNSAVLVIDNLEMIFSSAALMEELASIVILLDDARYAKFSVKLLIVGVPSDAKRYLSKTHASVGNRLSEIPEVSNLSSDQVRTLIKTGFSLLKLELDEETLDMWQKHVFEITMGYAQPVQEYCQQLGYVLEDSNWKIEPEQLKEANIAWLKQGLSQASGLINEWMNKRETKAGRRNQVLYVLSKSKKKTFHVNDVESALRLEFASSTKPDQTLGVGQILSELSKGQNAILKRTQSEASYEFRDARFAMALRASLYKDPHRFKISKLDSPVADIE
ncbi:ATP-binding protein [Granulicella pectinivorans]|nr:ATP-binding protein [Granulicella pectinivorans]